LYQLPLYQGPVPPGLFKAISTNLDESAFDIVNEFVSDNSIKHFSPKTSLVVRVVDEQRAAHFLHPLANYVPSKKYIPLNERDQYKYLEKPSGGLV
jgi:hypothetical protein